MCLVHPPAVGVPSHLPSHFSLQHRHHQRRSSAARPCAAAQPYKQQLQQQRWGYCRCARGAQLMQRGRVQLLKRRMRLSVARSQPAEPPRLLPASLYAGACAGGAVLAVLVCLLAWQLYRRRRAGGGAAKAAGEPEAFGPDPATAKARLSIVPGACHLGRVPPQWAGASGGTTHLLQQRKLVCGPPTWAHPGAKGWGHRALRWLHPPRPEWQKSLLTTWRKGCLPRHHPFTHSPIHPPTDPPSHPPTHPSHVVNCSCQGPP